MSLNDPSTADNGNSAQFAVEQLLESVDDQASSAAVRIDKHPGKHQPKGNVRRHDFRTQTRLSTAEMRRLRLEHEAFIQSLAARLTIHLRLEFGLQLVQLETRTYPEFLEGLGTPCHLTLFKVEPLRGICILELSPRLGLMIIDRLMGGPGQAGELAHELSEVETALLDQAVQLILGEWCRHWAKIKELRPVLLGHENTSRYLQTSPPETVMLCLTAEVRIGGAIEKMQIGFPYAALEPLTRGLEQKLSAKAEEMSKGLAKVKPKWNRDFDDLPIALNASWPGVKLTARNLVNLKVGDVIPLPPEFANSVRLHLAGTPRYLGRLGTSDQRWAIELSEPLRT